MKKLLALLGVSAIFLTACGTKGDERQRFIDGTIEAACHIFQAENIFDPVLADEAKEIYKKYGFEAEDDTIMEALTKKYENDEEVKSAISKGLEECGGDIFSELDSTLNSGTSSAPDTVLEGSASDTAAEDLVAQ